MRTRPAILATLSAIALVACGSHHSSGEPLPQLDRDYAPDFAGTWYGSVTATIAGQSSTESGAFDLGAPSENVVVIVGACAGNGDVLADVTSPTTFKVRPTTCPPFAVTGCSAITIAYQSGTGELSSGTLSISMSGTASGCGSTFPMSLAITGTRTPPQPIDHGPPSVVVAPTWGTAPSVPLTIDASGSTDPDGRSLTFAWTFVSGPATPSLVGATTSRPVFTASVEGDYQLSLTVTATDGQTANAGVLVHVYRPLTALSHRVVDAEYSRALERVVMVDANPSALYVLDPAAMSEIAVPLSLPPQCVSVAPDGLHAVVGHNGWISYVDLSVGTVEKTIPITADVGDCVLGGNGWAYLFPRVDQWVAIHNVQIATGVETLTGSWSIYAGSKARLHPDGTALYTIDPALSPTNPARWSISGGAAVEAWESPYWGDYPIGSDLWIARDGLRMFTAAGTAFRLSSVQSQDLLYAGALSGITAVRHLDTSTAEIAAIPGSAYGTTVSDLTVELFDPTYLGHTGRITLPRWIVGTNAYDVHGRFVFYGADGTHKYVVAQADPSSGLLWDTTVIAY